MSREDLKDIISRVLDRLQNEAPHARLPLQ